MKTRRIFALLPGLALVLISVMLPGCKGRTAENMEPTGDTVEVNISNHDDIVTTLPDSIEVPE